MGLAHLAKCEHRYLCHASDGESNAPGNRNKLSNNIDIIFGDFCLDSNMINDPRIMRVMKYFINRWPLEAIFNDISKNWTSQDPYYWNSADEPLEFI